MLTLSHLERGLDGGDCRDLGGRRGMREEGGWRAGFVKLTPTVRLCLPYLTLLPPFTGKSPCSPVSPALRVPTEKHLRPYFSTLRFSLWLLPSFAALSLYLELHLHTYPSPNSPWSHHQNTLTKLLLHPLQHQTTFCPHFAASTFLIRGCLFPPTPLML